VNLSTQINSDGRELYFREFPSQGFSLYTSTRNSDGYGDVRMIKDSINTRKPEEVKPVVVAAPIVDANSVVITGKVTNSKNGAGIPARLIFRADSTRSALASAEGIYSIVLKRAKVYAIEIEAQGFVSLSERLDMQSMTMNTTEMNFQLQPIEVGTVVNLKSVLFELGTTDLVEESYSELNVVVDFLKTNPKVEIELEGHTDNRGDMNKNLVLSQQRVDKIKSYLVSKGIGAKRISGKGYGGSRPIATSNTEEARKLNRRVEFRIVKY
jgi:outer membrane protein OmpA-like peptidoglycan-associated protein